MMRTALCTDLQQNLEEAAATYQQNQNEFIELKMKHTQEMTELETAYENKVAVGPKSENVFFFF
jgi:low affinity Fe/Cu permease